MHLRVLDVDGSVASQPAFAALLGSGEARRVEARDLAPRLRIVASRAALRELSARLHEDGAGRRRGEPEVIFYGSGDFHHLTYAFLERLARPVSVVHFDNHPDWTRFPGTVNCGSWVSRALEMPHVRRIVTVGPCSDDLMRPQIKMGNLGAVREGRLEVHAWRAGPTRYWGAPISAPCAEARDGRLEWRCLAERSWPDFLDELVCSLPTQEVWLTIDKDVLAPSEAATNWDQGEMTLDHILAAIEALASHCKVLGADVCGDYSIPHYADPFRAFLSWADHPAVAVPGDAEIAINDRTNALLVNAFQGAFI